MTRRTWRSFAAEARDWVIVGALGVLAVVAAWNLYWWAASHGANNQYQVNTHSQGYQAALVQQLTDLASDYPTATDGQRTEMRGRFCQLFQNLTEVPNNLANDHDIEFDCQH